jgi:hypothetical protein
MRSSTFIAVLGAGLAIASPIVRKALTTEVVTDMVLVYVTETIPDSATTTPVTTVSLQRPDIRFQSYYRPTLPPFTFSL